MGLINSNNNDNKLLLLVMKHRYKLLQVKPDVSISVLSVSCVSSSYLVLVW